MKRGLWSRLTAVKAKYLSVNRHDGNELVCTLPGSTTCKVPLVNIHKYFYSMAVLFFLNIEMLLKNKIQCLDVYALVVDRLSEDCCHDRIHLWCFIKKNRHDISLSHRQDMYEIIGTQHGVMQPSMANLNSPSSRVVKDSTPFRCRIFRCKNFGKGESWPSLFLDMVNLYLVKFRHRWILNERTFYSFIILFIWKWILT